MLYSDARVDKFEFIQPRKGLANLTKKTTPRKFFIRIRLSEDEVYILAPGGLSCSHADLQPVRCSSSSKETAQFGSLMRKWIPGYTLETKNGIS